MSKQHQTLPNEPEEAPVRPERPGVEKPADPNIPGIPEEAPGNLPNEIPSPPEETEELAAGKGHLQDSVAAELKNRDQ